jgi:hypothetical protein
LPRVSTLRHDDTPLPFDLPSVRRKKRTVDFAGGNQSSNGGVLLLREAERKHGVCVRLAEAMPDRRDPDRIRHAMSRSPMRAMTRGRYKPTLTQRQVTPWRRTDTDVPRVVTQPAR